MITLYSHLQPQYKYELFNINFSSFHCTGRYELNKLTSLPMCGFIAQLVEHRTGIAVVTGSNPVEALIFFQVNASFQLLKLENLLRWSLFTSFNVFCHIPHAFSLASYLHFIRYIFVVILSCSFSVSLSFMFLLVPWTRFPAFSKPFSLSSVCIFLSMFCSVQLVIL